MTGPDVARSGALERTRLAWERTALAVAVASVGAVAVFDSLRTLTALAGVVGLAGALVTLVAVVRRYPRVAHHARAHGTHLSPALAVVSLAAAVLALGAVCVGFILVDAAS